MGELEAWMSHLRRFVPHNVNSTETSQTNTPSGTPPRKLSEIPSDPNTLSPLNTSGGMSVYYSLLFEIIIEIKQ